jgi:hypothetical protein
VEFCVTGVQKTALRIEPASMIPKSGNRFSAKIMLKQEAKSAALINPKVMPL